MNPESFEMKRSSVWPARLPEPFVLPDCLKPLHSSSDHVSEKPLARKPKSRMHFTFHPSMMPLVEKLKAKQVTPSPEPPPPPEPPKRIVRHHPYNRVAVLCVGQGGATLTDGLKTVVLNSAPSNGELVKEVVEFEASRLTLADRRTSEKWRDIRKSGTAPKQLEVGEAGDITVKKCKICNKTNCHVWTAAAVMAKIHRYPFCPVEH